MRVPPPPHPVKQKNGVEQKTSDFKSFPYGETYQQNPRKKEKSEQMCIRQNNWEPYSSLNMNSEEL